MNKLNYKLGILYRDNDKTDVKKLKMKYRRVLQVRACRIRKKTGLKITSKNEVGLRLEDKICVY